MRSPSSNYDSNSFLRKNTKKMLVNKPNDAERNASSPTVRIALPFKYQGYADLLRKQLIDLSQKTCTVVQPVFVNNKINKYRVQEKKPPIVTKQCVVYRFQCDLRDARYTSIHWGIYTSAWTSIRANHFLLVSTLETNTVLSRKTLTNSFCPSISARHEHERFHHVHEPSKQNHNKKRKDNFTFSVTKMKVQ